MGDTDGNGELSTEEFMAGAKEMGISEDAAKAMWKKHAGEDGKMNRDEFARAFGIGPDEIMERCFEHYGNPAKAFDEMDVDHDGLLSPCEWEKGGKKMGLTEHQIKRIFGDMDKNHDEHTAKHISKK